MTSIRICKYLSIVLFGAAALGVVGLLAGTPMRLAVTVWGVDFGIWLDPLSAALLGFLASVVWLVSAYAQRNLIGQARAGRFGRLLIAAACALTLLVAGASLPVIAVGWTLSGFALTRLVAHTGSPVAWQAANYVGRRLMISDIAIWSAVVVAGFALPSSNRQELAELPIDASSATLVAAILGIAAIARSGLFPMQSWLAETAEAPSPVSAFLHAGIVNGAGILGALMWPVFATAPVVLAALVVVGLVTVAVGTMSGAATMDVKGKLATSTTAQMGYMTVQLGVGLPAAAVLHLIGHGYYKAWLFLRAGGAVTRSRQHAPAGRGQSAQSRSFRAIGAVGLALVFSTLLSAPAATATVSSLGMAALLPFVMAQVAVAVAVAAVARDARNSLASVAAVVLAGACCAAAYQWLLLGWEHLLAGSLPLAPAWSPVAGSVAVATVLAGFVFIAVMTRRVKRNPTGALAVHLTTQALPPGSKHWPSHRRTTRTLSSSTTGTPHLDSVSAEQLVAAAGAVCAPNWPLRSFVAANPLAGLQEFDFRDAAAISADYMGGRAYLPLRTYAEMYEAGLIEDSALRNSMLRSQPTLTETSMTAAIDQMLSRASTEQPQMMAGSGPRRTVSQAHADLWCQRAWSSATDISGPGPWQLWRAAAATPAYGRAVKARSTPAMVAELPHDAASALASLLNASGLDRDGMFHYVIGLLLTGPGWASHAAWRDRQGGGSALVELVALRCAIDLFVNAEPTLSRGNEARSAKEWLVSDQRRFRDEEIWQAALDSSNHLPLTDRLTDRAKTRVVRKAVAPASSVGGADAQLVFCIDVRSGPVREEIERSERRYQTFGFAGFFGAAVRYQKAQGLEFDQCPVIVKPAHVIREELEPATRTDALRTAVTAASSAPLTPLVFAECFGAFSGVAAFAHTIAPASWQAIASAVGLSQPRWGRQQLGASDQSPHQEVGGLPVGLTTAAKTSLAASALRAIGLVDNFAPFLIICGHGSTTENNAFASGYDCGACGGNSGAINARVLAEAINDPHVRAALARQGLVIGSSTIAIAAIHDTTTDVIELDPDSADTPGLEVVRRDLASASERVRVRRLTQLPGRSERGGTDTAAQACRRAADWAQAFPEWGLAGNTAFVIGPRWLTRGMNLKGRVFLHSYDPNVDVDGSILELLLTAPTVVTHWISSQYYFSTVDPVRFGAGDKTTHNVVGDVGVLTGAHGDLRIGLPWQATYPQEPTESHCEPQHVPVRIMIVVWASPEAVSRVLLAHPNVSQLFANGWAYLVSIDPETADCKRLTRALQWVRVQSPDVVTQEV